MFKKVLNGVLLTAEVFLTVHAVTAVIAEIYLISHDASLRISVDYPNKDNARFEFLSPNDQNKKE